MIINILDKGGIKSILKSGDLMQLPNRQKNILLLIAENIRISISEAAKQLGIVRSVAQKHFVALTSKGIIGRIGHKRGGYWKILVSLKKVGI